MVTKLPSGTTPQELDQAQRLIFSGKEFATRGDPKLQRIVAFLKERGFESPESAKIRRQFVEQKQQEAQKKFEEEQTEDGIKRVPSDFVGPLEPGTIRETETVPAGFVGPIRPGVKRTVPSDFVGPVRPGVTREFDQPFLEERVVEIAEFEGEKVPITEVLLVSETGERFAASPEQRGFFREQERQQAELIVPEGPKGFLEKAEFFFEEKRQDVQAGSAGGLDLFLGSVAAGAAASGLGTARFVGAVATDPLGTGARTIAGIGRLPSALQKIGPMIASEPGFAAGFIGAEALQLKGAGLATKVTVRAGDVLRTGRLQELKTTDVIAPEFFKGQTFPTIRRGQTAGELLGEFKPFLPGETRPGGFTAARTPLKRDITQDIVIGRGTSEVPGLFQAPKVSPRFLRISREEQQLISTKFFGETLKPSVFRVTPEKFELLPGVSPRRAQPLGRPGIKPAREFFETAPKGRSFIPFLKTEKEAIIPFGTVLQPKPTRFFIKFEGRRVPIFEFETAPARLAKVKRAPKDMGLPTARDIQRSLSESRVGRTGVVSPSELLSRVRTRSMASSIKSSLSSGAPSIVSRDIASVKRSDIISRPSTRPTFRISGVPSIISSRGGLVGKDRRAVPPLFSSLDDLLKEKKRPKFFGDIQVPKRPEGIFRQERAFQRTPSLGAVLKSEFGLRQQKFTLAAERTGLVERKFEQPQLIKPLGPFKI